jgi:signal transduction histidine kinase
MLEDSDRLLQTIEQVLRAGSSGSRWRSISRTRIDLADITQECVALARTRFHLADEALVFERGTTGKTEVIGDPDELKAAIWNLIDNAVKYSSGDVRVHVTLEESEGGRLAVRVTDSGVGISPAELKRIFRRFYRIPASVAIRAKGSGLGLFIVRSVARKHGGRAFAESRGQGHGSTFTLLLPKASEA